MAWPCISSAPPDPKVTAFAEIVEGMGWDGWSGYHMFDTSNSLKWIALAHVMTNLTDKDGWMGLTHAHSQESTTCT